MGYGCPGGQVGRMSCIKTCASSPPEVDGDGIEHVPQTLVGFHAFRWRRPWRPPQPSQLGATVGEWASVLPGSPGMCGEAAGKSKSKQSILMALMLKPDEEVDTSLRLAEMGLDSLMAVEPRRWARQACGLMVSVLEIIIRNLG